MKAVRHFTDEERADLAGRGFDALADSLGLVDAIRFIQLHRPGKGDYTRDRHAFWGDMTMPEAIRRMGQPELAEQVERDEAARAAAEGGRIERPAA